MRPQRGVDTSHTTPRYSVASTNSTNHAFRNITSDLHNVSKIMASTPGGFLSVKSSDHAVDEGLVSKLYGRLEAQESAMDRLQFQLTQEKEERQKLEEELADTKEDLDGTKKRFANYRKQERELRNKTQLDKKERQREDSERWSTNHQEVERLQKTLEAKNQKLAEFESMCSNLQEALDKEKQRICHIYTKDMKEAEQRLAVSTEMLQSCSAKLSSTKMELQEERKMKQVLIQINEALQGEVSRLKEQQQQYPDMIPSSNSTVSSFRPMTSKEECDDRTHDIIQDLQIEDALFYFEKVKTDYHDKPKVYRVFLEIIRDYKSRRSSTPEIMARISKLFAGNTKLIVGFNRFLPTDFHISEADVADLQGYRRSKMVPAPTKPIPEPALVSDKSVAAPVLENAENISKVDQSTIKEIPEDDVKSETAVSSKSSSMEPNKSKDLKHTEKLKVSDPGEKKKRSGHKKVKRKSKQSTSEAKKPPRTSKAPAISNTSKEEEEDLEPINLTRKSSSVGVEAAGPLLTASTSSSGDPIENLSTMSISRKQSANSGIPYVTSHKSSSLALGTHDEDEESRQDAALLSAAEPLSPSEQEVETPRVQKFASFAMSSVDSSQVFGGIDTLEETLGDGLLPAMLSLDHHNTLDQTTVVPDTDRYEVVVDDDDDGNAVEVEYRTGYQQNDSIEVIADSFMTGSFSRSYYSHPRKGSSSSPSYGSDSEWWEEPDDRN